MIRLAYSLVLKMLTQDFLGFLSSLNTPTALNPKQKNLFG